MALMNSDSRATLRKFAEELAEDLFTNGQGERADQLVLTVDSKPPRDLGGWGRGVIIDKLVAALLLREGWDEMKVGEPDETPQGWQDISTAPKDGTWILSFGKLWTLPTLAQWNTARNCWQDMDHALWQVTHWMTLPVPPPGVKEGTHDEENKGAEDRAEDRDHSRNARQTGSVEGRQSSPESVVGEGVGASPLDDVLANVNAALTKAGSRHIVGTKDGQIVSCTIDEIIDDRYRNGERVTVIDAERKER